MTRRIKFIWGASRVIRARWVFGLLGFYERIEGVPGSGVAISVRGLLIWSAALLLATYGAGAAAVFAIWHRNPYNQLTYADAFFYPVRRAAISEMKGRAFIAEGTVLFQQQKYFDAANLFRLGLARYPQDRSARLQLAQFYLLANQRALAVKVLEEGLGEDYPGRPYLESVFQAFEQGEDHAAVNDVASRYVAGLNEGAMARDRRWLEAKKVAALIAGGRAGDALAFAQTLPPGDTASEHQVLALLALQRAPEALALLEAGQHRPGADRRTSTRLRVRVLREMGRLDEMDSALAKLHELAPADPAALVYGVVQRAMSGRADAAAAAFDDYVFRFGGSVANLLLLAEPLAEIKQLGLLQRCAAAAAERGYPVDRFNGLLVQVLVGQGRWGEAESLLRRMPPATGPGAAAAAGWRHWMQRLIDAASSPADTAQLALVELVRTRSWPTRVYRESIEAMTRAGRLQTAYDLVGVAMRAFPQNPWLLAKSGELGGRMAAEKTRRAEAAGPAPPRELSEGVFLQQLDEFLREKNWEQAEQLMREARALRPEPAWLATRAAVVRLALVRTGHARGDTSAVLAAARSFLTGEANRNQQLLDVAREFERDGDKAAALMLAREVMRRSPGFPPAQRLIAEWQPETAKK